MFFSRLSHKTNRFHAVFLCKMSNFIWSVPVFSVLITYCPSEITKICAYFQPDWSPFDVEFDPPQNFSAIIDKICSSFVCRSTAGAIAPLLPHKNLIWNSVLEIKNHVFRTFSWNECFEISNYLKESSSNSSIRLSGRTACAFRRYIGKLLMKFRRDSKWAWTVDRPKSAELFSHW